MDIHDIIICTKNRGKYGNRYIDAMDNLRPARIAKED